MAKTEKRKRAKKQRSITAKLMRGIIMILFLTVFIPFFAYYNLPEWVYYLAPGTRLWLAIDEINGTYGTGEFDETVRVVEKRLDSNIEIYTADGRFIYSTAAMTDQLPTDLSRAPTVDDKYQLTYQTVDGEISAGDRGFLLRTYTSTHLDIQFLDVYGYLEGGERIEICMQVSQLSTTGKLYFIISFVAIMISMALALFIIMLYIRRFTKSVKQVCDTTDKMARLDFSEKCPETSVMELSQLSDSINTLSDSLDIALTDLKQKNEKLQEDIEKERTIDNLRQTFISGISHELKTPIAIIQGYAEGAKMFYQSGNAAMADSYCDTVMEEATRMNTMILKLLEITKYDSGAYEPVREDFDVRTLVQNWFDRNASILEDRGVRVINRIPEGLVGNGDSVILDSVVNNYLSNALSHVEGEMRIEADWEEVDGKHRIYVFNTGKEIQKKDIDNIWTSFYRADKSLSRSQGRFGLGLAIVASIQKLHNEKYGVENVKDGVRFWFDVKKGISLPGESEEQAT